MDPIEENFIVRTQPKVKPYVLFIDDTESHFSASFVVYGLLVKPNETSLKLSRNAQKKWAEQTKDFEKYDKTLGISENGFKALQDFVKKNHSDIRTIILDWDKTITVHGTFKTETIDKYIAECYFGGMDRMKAMKRFFKECSRHKVHVIVLTCNGRARTEDGRMMFSKALSFVGGNDINIFFTDKTKIALINVLAKR